MEAAKHKSAYRLSSDGRFVITDYNYSKPLANFFPGIAGKYGIPMWVFYVNRGQAISSFGTDGKDSAILEFQPANKAWQLTPLHGFRTFIKGKKAGKDFFYEPFHNGLANRPYKVDNSLSMSASDLSLSEKNTTLGIEVEVRYFSVPQDSFAALARVVTVRNTGKGTLNLQLLDGLPQIVPYGENNWCLKEMSRTIEAWMRIENLDRGVPVYRLSVDPGDRPQVIHIQKGNFYLGFVTAGEKSRIIKPIVDPDCIFGPVSDFSVPRNFLGSSWKGYPARQQLVSKMPCGFLPLDMKLGPGEAQTVNALIGTVRKTEMLEDIVRRVTRPGYLEAKARENREVIDGISAQCATSSSSPEFDLYCRQTFLDNVLRGGTPVIFSDGSAQKVFYLYSRKHGDLERDYNRFQIQETFFSQGNGNYRDINQNRRSDVWFNPRIGDFNAALFINLLQSDGYNPLVVKGTRFVFPSAEQFTRNFQGVVAEKHLERLCAFVLTPFTPGELVLFLDENAVSLTVSVDGFLNSLLPLCRTINEAEHGEGYWIDHWHYNLDLIETYLAVYPEKHAELLFERKDFTFYDSDAVVAPRSAKYVLLDGKPRQLHSVVHDPDKREMIAARTADKHLARSAYGTGDIMKVSLFAKLLCLFVNKYASLDPFGTGIEMEADKPNWYDALNGLPALSGSSSCETFELKRLAALLKDECAAYGRRVSIPEEIAGLLEALSGLTLENLSGALDDFGFWSKSGALKEDYRRVTLCGFSGKESSIDAAGIAALLENALKKLERGLANAFDKASGLYSGYFINEVVSYESAGGNCIRPTAFRQKRLPFFLEGQVHALRTSGAAGARALHQAVRKSELYDAKLKMYKVTASLAGMPEEIGRCRVFTPGWLENESVFLHMEYKYILELLKCGLYDEFYAEFRNVLIPFQKAEVYGRSILENSSFLVSSAFPYRHLHGNGFVARLSGSTAEFAQIWLLMNAGRSPFRLAGGRLVLKLAPALPRWLFKTAEKTYTFSFLGATEVIYRNPKMKDTYGAQAAAIRRLTVTDNAGIVTVIESDTIPSPLAERVRSGEIARIEALLE